MKPRLLFLTHRVPYPPNRGDRIRTFHFLKHLARHANVRLGCLADEPVADETSRVLAELCERVAIVPVEPRLRWVRAARSFVFGQSISTGVFESPQLERIVNSWARDVSFDASLVSSSALTGYQRLDSLQGIPAFVDLIDVDSQKWLDYANKSLLPKSWIFHQEGKRLRQLETSLAECSQGLTVVSEAEADIYRSFCPKGPIQAISNGVDIDYFAPSQPYAGDAGCVFLGALDYKPNIDGAVWFCNEVWPEIHERHPDQSIRLVGRAPVREVRDLSDIAGVDVVGSVADVRSWLREAAVAVVPLHIARGVQNKVLECMAMGKAVIASPASLTGLQIESGIHVLKATSVKSWIECVSSLLADRERREEIGTAGLAYVTSNHRWDQCLTPLMGFLGMAPQTEQRVSLPASMPVQQSDSVPGGTSP